MLFAGGEEKLPAAVLADPAAHYGREVASPDRIRRRRCATLAPGAPRRRWSTCRATRCWMRRRACALAAVALDLGLEYRAPGHRARARRRQELVGRRAGGGGDRNGQADREDGARRAPGGLLRERGRIRSSCRWAGAGRRSRRWCGRRAAPASTGCCEISRGGGHASSDYLEDAVLAGVTTVGCRRCGEGPAGEVLDSNVAAGVRSAMALDPGVVVIEGSGPSASSGRRRRTVCVVAAGAARPQALTHLGPLRLLRAALVVVMGGTPSSRRSGALVAELGHGAHGSSWRVWSPSRRGGAAGLPGGALHDGRRRCPGAHPSRPGAAGNSTSRWRHPTWPAAPPSPLTCGPPSKPAASVYPTELKAAAIDTVAEHARRAGAPTALIRHRPEALRGQPGLDARAARRVRGRGISRARVSAAFGEPVVVRSDYALPYSKGLMAQSMMATGMSASRAFELARAVEQRLAALAWTEVAVDDLRLVAEEVLREQESADVVERFRQWWSLRRLADPLVILIGGVTGVGKSTVATQLATRLGITRVIATDQVRQVVRAFFSREFMPAVHYSSFDAFRALPGPAPSRAGRSRDSCVRRATSRRASTRWSSGRWPSIPRS